MIHRLKFLITLTLLICISSGSVYKLYHMHSYKRDLRLSRISTISPAFLKMFALEFHGILSDYLFMNVLAFTGDKTMLEKQTDKSDWQKIYKLIMHVLTLDPEASDPFILATTVLPWEANMVEETNKILLKSAEVRVDDYRPYFFLWYNYYHFLKDPKMAGYYLEKASKKPKAPKYFAPLVTRMKLYAGEVESSIIFLKSLSEDTAENNLKKYLTTRIHALEKILFLEGKIKEFVNRYKRHPKNLEELVSSKVISQIPQDPYGGKFFIIAPGRVYTTSKLVHPKANKN